MTGDRGLPDGLRLRRYEAADHDQVWALHWECVLDEGGNPKVDPKYDADLTRLEEVYLREGANFWVVEAPDGLVEWPPSAASTQRPAACAACV